MPVILKNFNRQHTIIRLPQFGAPKLSKLTELELPRGSILHYQPTGVSEVGPSQRLPILEKAEKLIAINHIVDLTHEDILGKPIVNTDFNTHIQRDIMAYHRANKRMRRMRETSLIERDPRTLLVENYAMLPGRYRYRETLMSWYERWHNIYETIFQRMASDAVEFDRQNYLFLEIPDTLPAIATLKRAESSRTPSTLKTLKEDNVLLFLELWTWLGVNREKGMMNRFSNDMLKRINITLIYRDRFVNMNLGEVNFWRKDKNTSGLVNPDQMQRRFYKTAVELISRAAIVMPSDVQSAPADEINDSETLPKMSARTEEVLEDEQSNETSAMGNVVSELAETRDNSITEDDTSLDDAESIEADIQQYEKLDLDEEADFTVVQQADVAKDDKPVADIDQPITVEDGIEKACEAFIAAGTLSVREYNRITELGKRYQSISNPFGGEGTLADMLHVDPVELKLERDVMYDDVTVFDKEMMKTVTPKFDKQYVKNVLPKDVVSSVVAIQRSGYAVTDYSVENIVDAVNSVQEHTIKVSPVNGAPAVLRFTLPLINEDGYWKANDITYTMHKQRVDLPIRKTDYDTVALTTFYGKNFVQRSEKMVSNRQVWLTDQIAKRGIDFKDTSVTQVKFGDVFTPDYKLPRDYTAIAMRISSFEAGGVVYHFDYENRERNFSPEDIKEFDGKELVPVGKGSGSVYAMDLYSNIYRKKGKELVEIGTIGEVLQLPLEKEPKEYTELSIMGKAIPLAFIFSYYLGMENMLKLFKVPHRFVEPNERISPTFDEVVVKMNDAKLIITPDTAEQRLLVNGLVPYLKLTRTYTRRDFNSQDVYLNLLAKDGLTARYLTELDLMRTMYVDPVSERLLKKMGEPITFMGLLRRSNEMLTLDNAPPETDMDEMHLFGKQRIAGAVYTALVRSIREYQNKPGTRKQLELHSTAVWSAIAQDGSVAPASNANPIHHIKQQDVVTFGGTGGRSRRSMVKRTRKYHKSELGVISGDTVDSGDVSITAYLAADPQLEDVDGTVKADRKSKPLEAAQILSNSVLLAPFTMYDDGKRGNFVGIQHGSGVAAEGYQVTGIRTAQEKAIAHKSNSTHARIAQDAGKVIDVTADSVEVEYGSGKSKRVEKIKLGRNYGQHEGVLYGHDLVANVKKGQAVEKGHVLAYNSKFFVPDEFNPTQVNWKAGVMARIALIEGTDSLEDSCAVSQRLSQLQTTEIIAQRHIRIKFDQAVHGLVEVGNKVDPDSILCTIEDALTATSGAFGDESASTLSSMAAQTPKSDNKGYIDKIEVFYNGELEDMSESVRAIVRKSDKQRRAESLASGGTVADNGRVNSTFRVEGVPVEMDSVVIRIYISKKSPSIGGDKYVFGNQMKTTIRRVMTGINESADGLPLDGIFGKKSVDNRIVLSFYKYGTGNVLCRLEAEECRKIAQTSD